MPLKTVDLKPRIGSEVIADAEALLRGQHGEQLRALLEERGVLLFRRVGFTAEQQVAFARTLGTVFESAGDIGSGGVVTISMDKNVMKEAAIFKGSFLWHFDGSTGRLPPRASVLSASALSSTGGGETEFASTTAAYDDLPEADKRAYDRVRVLHSLLSDYRLSNLDPSEEAKSFWRRSQPAPTSHPLVWHHQSGRNSLVVGSTASHFEDDGLDDGLLQRLLEWATQPQYVYRHTWELGDMLVYDNTGVLHRALPYDEASGRVLQRTKLVGEEECA